jgi:rod shape-determining protein MreC
VLRRVSAPATQGPTNPLVWLSLFVSLSIGATFAHTQHWLDRPRDVAARAIAPVQAGASRIAAGVTGLTDGWQEISRLREENAALHRTVDELLQETVRLRSAELENRELREQLRYTRAHDAHAFLPAEVIGLDSSALLGYAVINQGTSTGVVEGMTVQSTAGLVGRVVSTSASTSRVLLINTPSSSVNARIQGTPGATGRLRGQSDGRLVMDLIPQAEPVRLNDIVVTSGLGGALPPNVPIGRVIHIDSRDVDLFQRAIVEPFVNFRRLGHVLVATGFTPSKL